MLTEAFVFLEQNMSKIQELLSNNQLLCQHSFTEYLQLEEECTAYLTDCAHRKFEQVLNIFIVSFKSRVCIYYKFFLNNLSEYGTNGTKLRNRTVCFPASWTS